MITKEQYEYYKKLVDEYEQAEFEEKSREAEEDLNEEWTEDDVDDDYDPLSDDDFDPHDSRHLCKCGAWYTNAQGKLTHVADCVCGAE
jgi:hypothetical protein